MVSELHQFVWDKVIPLHFKGGESRVRGTSCSESVSLGNRVGVFVVVFLSGIKIMLR